MTLDEFKESIPNEESSLDLEFEDTNEELWEAGVNEALHMNLFKDDGVVRAARVIKTELKNLSFTQNLTWTDHERQGKEDRHFE